MRIRTSPGEILREEFMKPLGLTGASLAKGLDVPANRVTEILRGRRDVSADTALRLARFFGTTPRFWLNLQASYNLSLVESEFGADIRRKVRPHKAAA